MKLRTEYKASFKKDLVNYSSPVMTVGSCFADHIGNFLESHEFDSVSNPFGILFNPVSIAEAIRNAVSGTIAENGIVEREGHFFHYSYHSSINAATPGELISRLQGINRNVREKLVSARVLVITFGTSWVYRHRQLERPVANCHKIPQHQFEKVLLNPEDLNTLYADFVSFLRSFNPNLEIMLTVSPVRHVKDGLHENNLSKSILLLLCHALQERFSYVHYFPAYEIVLDDLRDYRFFKADLVHPTDQAVEYVLEQFGTTYFSETTRQLVQLKSDILKLQGHRFLNASEAERVAHELKIADLLDRFQALRGY